jgi:hypothetical protein
MLVGYQMRNEEGPQPAALYALPSVTMSVQNQGASQSTMNIEPSLAIMTCIPFAL